MFTGIIEEIGSIRAATATSRGGSLTISASRIVEGTSVGDSIAVNGACLTVTEVCERGIKVDVMPETLRCTTMGSLRTGSLVNLERAMLAEGRFGGHVVTGHVDGIAAVRQRYREGTAVWLGLSDAGGPAVVSKGSIAVDGVSLTVSRIARGLVWVSLIPHTRSETTLGGKRIGDRCNVEHDILASYAVSKANPGALTVDKLKENGF